MSPAGSPHVRRNVWTLAASDKTLEHYAHAVKVMKARDPSDPTSWSYQAAIHGTHSSQSRPLWNHCQHATWFFLPWHRMFLFYFERIVRAAIVHAGGPKDWALPFWDYGAGGKQATIPHAFRDPKVNGKDNPLYVAERAQGINAGLALSPAVASAAHALGRPRFTGVAQFGGGVTGFAHFSNRTGTLEWTPHNQVHDVVGGGGWMSDPDMAARDPIFWLHHSNIDRLWFRWSRTHKEPKDPRWRQEKFAFFDEHGNEVRKTPADVLDIEKQLGYTYERAPAAPHAAGPPPTPEEERPAMPIVEDSEAEEREPELVGATERPIELTGKPETVTVDIDRGAAEAALGAAAAKPEHVYLSVDDIEGERNPGTVYGLYVNLPDEASPAVAESHHAGNVSFFGIERARNPRGDEQPHNLQMTTEITDLARALEADGEWSGDRVEVSFRPLGLIPDDRPELAHALPESVSESDPPVRIGRVSILYS